MTWDADCEMEMQRAELLDEAEREAPVEEVDPREWAGYRKHARARQTNALIVLVRSDEFGVNCDDPDTKWTLLCETHGQTMGFRTRKVAEWFMPAPADWCECCQVEAGRVGMDVTIPGKNVELPVTKEERMQALGELLASTMEPEADEDRCGINLEETL